MITQMQFVEIQAMLEFSEQIPLSAFLLKHGTWQSGNELRDKYELLRQGFCFENAWKIARKHKLDYWEGYCWCPSETGEVFFHHAWCVDPASGEIVDVTWSDSQKCLYRGVHIPTSKLQDIVGGSQIFSALDRGRGLETATVKALFGWRPRTLETQRAPARSFRDHLRSQKRTGHIEKVS